MKRKGHNNNNNNNSKNEFFIVGVALMIRKSEMKCLEEKEHVELVFFTNGDERQFVIDEIDPFTRLSNITHTHTP